MKVLSFFCIFALFCLYTEAETEAKTRYFTNDFRNTSTAETTIGTTTKYKYLRKPIRHSDVINTDICPWGFELIDGTCRPEE